jgi:hypothetical protein
LLGEPEHFNAVFHHYFPLCLAPSACGLVPLPAEEIRSPRT